MPDEPPLDLLIVGAGIAGLQALHESLLLKLRVRALEKHALPGGKWSGHGIYDCVKIQQHKHDFFLPGVPWPDGTPDFATRDDMVAATDQFITQHELLPHIECRSEVVSAHFDEAKRLWMVTTSAGAVFASRFLTWAVGTLGPPFLPNQVKEALASFGGDVVHSHAYYRPLPYSGQHVVVLGFGASSVEIAQDLARNGSCASVKLVAPPKVQADGHRAGQDWCLSRVLPGDGSRFCSQGQTGASATLEARNASVREAMAQRHPAYPQCMPAALRPSGVLEDGGKPVYPGEDGRPLGGRVIVSEGFLDCVADKSISCHPGYLRTADARSVTVSPHPAARDAKPAAADDDIVLECDAVIACTGYEPPTARIARTMCPRPSNCETLYKGTWLADVPNAALIGHVYGFVAVPPFAGLQAKYVARVVSGAETLPSTGDMQRWVADVKGKYAVTQRLTENAYFRELRAAALGPDLAAKAPVGPGPPPETVDGLPCRPRGASAMPERPAVEGAAQCGGEALHFLEEVRSAGGRIAVLSLGAESGRAASDLTRRLRPAERAAMRCVEHAAVASYPWPADDGSMDLLLCSGGVLEEAGGVPPDARFVSEALRVLKPEGHAVIALREDGEGSRPSEWQRLFNDAERDGVDRRCSAQWRMVHKTAPRSLAGGGTYRVFVFRAWRSWSCRAGRGLAASSALSRWAAPWRALTPREYMAIGALGVALVAMVSAVGMRR